MAPGLAPRSSPWHMTIFVCLRLHPCGLEHRSSTFHRRRSSFLLPESTVLRVWWLVLHGSGQICVGTSWVIGGCPGPLLLVPLLSLLSPVLWWSWLVAHCWIVSAGSGGGRRVAVPIDFLLARYEQGWRILVLFGLSTSGLRW